MKMYKSTEDLSTIKNHLQSLSVLLEAGNNADSVSTNAPYINSFLLSKGEEKEFVDNTEEEFRRKYGFLEYLEEFSEAEIDQKVKDTEGKSKL